jgi:ribosomal protein S18 acetylase RimI-like enzyme
VWTIRSFLNTDTPALAKIWSAHHQSVHSHSACSTVVWDSCILSKPYFFADDLAIAIDDLGYAIGFVHFGFVGEESSQSMSKEHCAIHKICVLPSADEDAIARLLLAHAIHAMTARGAIVCTGLGAGGIGGFYQGIADGDNLMGVVASDTKSQKWLHDAGFVPHRPTECWELDLASFRPPMDRLQIQTRRTCTIGRMLDEDYEHWWTSAVLGHCEQTRFHLMLKSPPSLGGVLMCWYPDPTLVGLDSSLVRMILPDVPAGEESREQFLYLVAESMRQLQQDKKRKVTSVASADQQQTITLLQRLGFRSVEHGLIFTKCLKA